MDIKEEVRRRIADLTRFAYERGLRDGAQSALAEIDNMATEEQLGKVPAPSEAKPAKKRAAGKKRQPTKKKSGQKPKSIVIQEVVQDLLAKNGEARRDDVLAAAQAEDARITKFDLGNGLRSLAKRSQIKVSPDDRGLLLPA